MAQISKRYIDQTMMSRINELLFDLLLTLSDKKEVNEVLNELLTSTEKIMIAKRVACFYLLIKKVPIREIEDTLKISTCTITYFKHYLDRSTVIKDILSAPTQTSTTYGSLVKLQCINTLKFSTY